MIDTSYEQWRSWHRTGMYTALPFVHKLPLIPGRDRAADWTMAWESAAPYAVVLESGKSGRYTYLGKQPVSIIRGKGEQALQLELATGRRAELRGRPLQLVRSWMEPYRVPRLANAPKWTGGCAGFWGYDVARTIESLPQLASDDLDLPDYLFMRFDELWIVDHEQAALYCAVYSPVELEMEPYELHELYRQASSRAEEMVRFWRDLIGDSEDESSSANALRSKRLARLQNEGLQIDVEAMHGITFPYSKAQYIQAVRSIQSYIAQGDVFQVNLSLRQSRKVQATPEELYEWLRLLNPSPYMGLLRCPDFQLVSASPELLVQSMNGKLAARPIAGTRRRGQTEEEDGRMAEELRTNEKERAEHIMLVDLERNDLGRIADYGSVKVQELMVIEQYSHVMHLVSQVEARLAEGKDAYDVIAATFPGGTITGAPKIRTMEIIEELEPVRRGPYTGSLGWIDYNGDMEFNIIIRTMVVKDGQVHIQAGAGIVIDSEPEREYYESLSKAKALWKAIQYAERFASEAASSR